MLLIMFSADEVIDTIRVDGARLRTPDYIACLQEELIERNEEWLERHADSPYFALENVPSKMGYKSPLALHDTL